MSLTIFRKKFEVAALTGEDRDIWIRNSALSLEWDNRYAAVAVCSCGWFSVAIHGQEAESLAESHRAEHLEKGHVERGI